MPTIIVAPDPNANSFFTEAEVTTFLTDELETLPTWTAVQQQQAMTKATRKLSLFSWEGLQLTDYADNPLPFPDRTGLYDPNGKAIPSADPPAFLLHAIAYQAVEEYNVTQGTTTAVSQTVKSIKASVLAISFDTSTDPVATRNAEQNARQLGIPTHVYELVYPYLASTSLAVGSGGIRLCR